MPERYIRKILYLLVMISTICANTLFASEVNDGFNFARTVESRYFTIYIESGSNLQGLTMRLTVPPSIKAIIKEPLAVNNSYSLANELDTLFLAVGEIMDMRLPDFKCKIKVCRDAESLSAVADTLFGRPVRTAGFYVLELDTLYIDAENADINILGHELSHAVQCHYFVVLPPERIQEVLSGYVEYQLRKYTNTLP